MSDETKELDYLNCKVAKQVNTLEQIKDFAAEAE